MSSINKDNQDTGEWGWCMDHIGRGFFRCSICGRHNTDPSQFCPWCNSKMTWNGHHSMYDVPMTGFLKGKKNDSN